MKVLNIDNNNVCGRQEKNAQNSFFLQSYSLSSVNRITCLNVAP